MVSCGFIILSSKQKLAMLSMHLLTVEELALTVSGCAINEGWLTYIR